MINHYYNHHYSWLFTVELGSDFFIWMVCHLSINNPTCVDNPPINRRNCAASTAVSRYSRFSQRADGDPQHLPWRAMSAQQVPGASTSVSTRMDVA